MFDVHLQPFERRGLTGLEFPLPARVAALGGSLLVLAASFSGGPPGILGLGLAGLFLVGALYDEQWAFDPEGRYVYFRLGLIGLGRKRRWPFAEVEGLELTEFRRGLVPGAREETTGYRRARPAYAVLSLRFADGGRRVLERRPARKRNELAGIGQRLADASGLRYAREASW